MKRLSRDDARRSIQEAGLRVTAPRVAVLLCLSSAERPLSHSEVVEALGETDWDPATIYRNLVKLVDVSLARVASRAGGVLRYVARGDGQSPHLHPHFTCTDCGQVNCLPSAAFSSPAPPEWRRSIERAEVQLLGLCPSCLVEAAECS